MTATTRRGRAFKNGEDIGSIGDVLSALLDPPSATSMTLDEILVDLRRPTPHAPDLRREAAFWIEALATLARCLQDEIRRQDQTLSAHQARMIGLEAANAALVLRYRVTPDRPKTKKKKDR